MNETNLVDESPFDEYSSLIQRWEAELERRLLDVSELLELIVLYFNLTDIGFVSAHSIPDSLLQRAVRRMDELIQLGRKMYPAEREFDFWSLFSQERVHGKTVDRTRYEVLADAEVGPAALVAYVYSYGDAYRLEVDDLLRRTLPSSARGRWILSYAPRRTFPRSNE